MHGAHARSLVGELIRAHLPRGRAKNERGKKNPNKIKRRREIEVYREMEWKNTKGRGVGGGMEERQIGRHNTVAARRMRKPGESGGARVVSVPALALPSLSGTPESPSRAGSRNHKARGERGAPGAPEGRLRGFCRLHHQLGDHWARRAAASVEITF